MSDPNFIILYVNNPIASAAFYADLLGHPAIEASPGFAMFALESGVMLGLWAKHTVEPTPTTGGGGTEIAFALDDDAAVDASFSLWSERGLSIAQTPTRMDFGYTFVALDPDDHRVRVFAASAA